MPPPRLLSGFFRAVLAAVLFSLAAPASRAGVAEGKGALDPAKVIEADGSIALEDGSSYYIFLKDGGFSSGPIGLSGRTLDGTWKSPEPGRFVVTARKGWINGLSTGSSYHRIVFSIRPGKKEPLRSGSIPALMKFAAYFLIEEFVEIPAPAAEKATSGASR